jgi:hypothetical protein
VDIAIQALDEIFTEQAAAMSGAQVAANAASQSAGGNNRG